MNIESALRTTRVCFLGLLLGVVGCSGGQKELRAPADFPPLPPTAGTSVGILLAQGEALDLSVEQRSEISAIEAELTTANTPLQERLTKLDRSARPKRESQTAPRGGGGMRGGGMRGGGGGGKRGGGGGKRGGGAKKAPQSSSDGPSSATQAETQSLLQKLRHNNGIALARALEPLSSEQVSRAEKILDEHGHEIPEPRMQHADYETVSKDSRRHSRGQDPTRCLAQHLKLSSVQRRELKHLVNSSAAPSAKQQAFEESLTPEQRSKLDEASKVCRLRASRPHSGSEGSPPRRTDPTQETHR